MRVPLPLRSCTKGLSTIDVAAADAGACVSELERLFPEVTPRLRDETGQLLSSVNLYVNGEDIRHLSGLATGLSDRDELTIIVAIAGGVSTYRW